jgi:hypothetical protein
MGRLADPAEFVEAPLVLSRETAQIHQHGAGTQQQKSVTLQRPS